MVLKQDAEGNLLGHASLQVTDENGTVIAAWVSEADVHFTLPELQPGMVYCLTELEAPAEFAIADPIYFQLNDNGELELLQYKTDAEGNRELESTTPGENGRIIMIDAYLGTGTLPTTTTTVTTTTTTTAETTTTDPRYSTENNGLHTPSGTTDTTVSVEGNTDEESTTTTTTAATDVKGNSLKDSSTQSGTTANGNTTTTSIQKNTYSSNSSSSTKNVSSTPKTGDRAIVLTLTAGASLLLMMALRKKHK